MLLGERAEKIMPHGFVLNTFIKIIFSILNYIFLENINGSFPLVLSE